MPTTYRAGDTGATSISAALACALNLAARGLAVFPMSVGKAPLAGSHGVRDASTDPERVAELFGHPRAELVAIATGEASDISALDIDRQHAGATWWRQNRAQLPATWAWRTRSGGIHLAMKHRPGLRTVPIGTIGEGVAIRSTGASVIFWPGAGFPVLCVARPAPWPAWLLPPPKPAPPPATSHDGRPPHHVENALRGLVRVVGLASEGRRNSALFWAASRVAEMSARGEIARHHAEAVLVAAAAHCALDRREAAATIASAYRTGGR